MSLEIVKLLTLLFEKTSSKWEIIVENSAKNVK